MDRESVVQAGQQINRALHRIHRDLDLASEIRVDQLLRASFGENLHQGLQGPEVGYLGDFTQVFPRQLFLTEGPPSARKTAVGDRERIAVLTIPQQELAFVIGAAQFVGTLR